MIRAACLALTLLVHPALAAPRVIDDFADVRAWTAAPSDGVKLAISQVTTPDGGAMRLDFDFQRGAGYAIARREVDLVIDPHYRLSFDIWAEPGTPVNDLEFKLVDETGENVWWHNARMFAFPSERRTISYRARQITFAWGPSGGAPLKRLSAIEFAITAGTGGKGTVFIGNLRYERMDPPPSGLAPAPVVAATSAGSRWERPASGAGVKWTPSTKDREPSITLDMGAVREFGGLSIRWTDADLAPGYTVSGSLDGERWQVMATRPEDAAGMHHLHLPDAEARYLRVSPRQSHTPATLDDLIVHPVDVGTDRNTFTRAIISARGGRDAPRWMRGEQSYWTALGVDGDEAEALINEEGLIETGQGQFSLDAFVKVDGKAFGWADAAHAHTLERGWIPIPSVTRTMPGLTLEITALADGVIDRSTLLARYRLTNTSDGARRGSLVVMARPFQVLPPWHTLNMVGGVARIDTARAEDGTLLLDGRPVKSLTTPSRLRLDRLAVETTPVIVATDHRDEVTDDLGLASGGYDFDFDLEAGESMDVVLAVPMQSGTSPPAAADAGTFFAERVAAAAQSWDSKVNRVAFDLPVEAQRYLDSYRSTLAYILVNRDGPAIQPGSRTYDRTWIRDGALTATALHYAGHSEPGVEFVDWFAPFQYEDGKVPCCVDRRGPDPVPEHDSHGQYIYAVWTAYQFTGDTELLRRHWPRVRKAVAYIESLRAQRLTDRYRLAEGLDRAKYGVLPESISHEGYSAKPMHSYWDGFFALRGLKDAVSIARELEESGEVERLEQLVTEFRRSLYDSMRLAMSIKGIDFIPGCVELGDYDPTSTSAGIFPGGELGLIPEPQLTNTFTRYIDWFTERREERREWREYTPYEMRNTTSLLMLGKPETMHALMEFFFAHQRPQGWNTWGEIVWKDERAPRFVGDIPHTWVASDYVKAFRSMFAYERERDDALVVAAGLPRVWLESERGVAVRGMPTTSGPLDLAVARRAGVTTLDISGGVRAPPGGIVVTRSGLGKWTSASVDGREVNATADEIVIRALPARVELTGP